MYCFSLSEPLVVFIIDLSGALLRAQPAGNTLVDIHITRVLGNRDLKVTLLPFNALNIGKGYQLYVDVPADLDQFG